MGKKRLLQLMVRAIKLIISQLVSELSVCQSVSEASVSQLPVSQSVTSQSVNQQSVSHQSPVTSQSVS